MNLTPSDIHNEDICKTQLELLEQEKVDYQLIGRMRRVAGHTLFSYNSKTGEIKKASMVNNVGLGMDGSPVFHSRVTVEAGCYYEQALNEKNFVKRLKRRGLM